MPELTIHNKIDGWDMKVPFTGNKLTLGSGSKNTLCLQGDGVAEKHLKIYLSGDGWQVRNVSNSAGTTLDGAPLTEDLSLDHGAVLQFGPYTIEFREPKRARRPKTFNGETRVPHVDPQSSTPEPVAEPPALPEPVEADAAIAGEVESSEESFELEPQTDAATAKDWTDPLPAASNAPAPAETKTQGAAGGDKSAEAGKRESDRRISARVILGNVTTEMRPSGLLTALGMGSNIIPIRLVDLSERGAKVVTTAPVDSKLNYNIKLSHSKLGAIQVSARIVWEETIEHRTQYGEQMQGMVAGVHFESAGKKQTQIVRELMDKKAKGREGAKMKWR